FIADATGLLTTALTAFAVTVLLLLGFLYRVEFAQAILSLFVPMSVVGWLTVGTARQVGGLDAPDLGNILVAHRRRVQIVGGSSIFVTSMWGMWVNMNASVLG
ncbi:MAG: component of SufBCD complex, partial [Jannaschia sp.]